MCCKMCLLVLELVRLTELVARTPTPLNSTDRCGSEIINETARSAWGRSLVMAAPQWRANYVCFLSFQRIIYSPVGAAETLRQVIGLQDLTRRQDMRGNVWSDFVCYIWGQCWTQFIKTKDPHAKTWSSLTSKQMIFPFHTQTQSSVFVHDSLRMFQYERDVNGLGQWERGQIEDIEFNKSYLSLKCCSVAKKNIHTASLFTAQPFIE